MGPPQRRWKKLTSVEFLCSERESEEIVLTFAATWSCFSLVSPCFTLVSFKKNDTKALQTSKGSSISAEITCARPMDSALGGWSLFSSFRYEEIFGRLSDYNICVTNAMKEDLEVNCNITWVGCLKLTWAEWNILSQGSLAFLNLWALNCSTLGAENIYIGQHGWSLLFVNLICLGFPALCKYFFFQGKSPPSFAIPLAFQ